MMNIATMLQHIITISFGLGNTFLHKYITVRAALLVFCCTHGKSLSVLQQTCCSMHKLHLPMADRAFKTCPTLSVDDGPLCITNRRLT